MLSLYTPTAGQVELRLSEQMICFAHRVKKATNVLCKDLGDCYVDICRLNDVLRETGISTAVTSGVLIYRFFLGHKKLVHFYRCRV